MKFYLYLLVLAFAVAIAAGCGGSAGDKETKADPKKVICVVDGADITLGDFNAVYEGAKNLYKAPDSKQNDAQVRANTMENMIRQQVINALFTEKKIAVTDKEVDERLSQIKSAMGDKAFKAETQRLGMTEKSFRSEVRRQLLHEKYTTTQQKKIKVAQKDIDAYYKANATTYGPKTTTSVQQVVLKDEAEAKKALAAAKKAKDMAAVVKKYNKDVKNEGRAFYQKEQQFDAALAKAIFAASAGDVIGPIKGSQGFYVIKVVGKPMKTPAIPKAEAQKQIRDILASQQVANDFTKLVEAARKDAKLSDSCLDYQKAANQELMKPTTLPAEPAKTTKTVEDK